MNVLIESEFLFIGLLNPCFFSFLFLHNANACCPRVDSMWKKRGKQYCVKNFVHT